MFYFPLLKAEVGQDVIEPKDYTRQKAFIKEHKLKTMAVKSEGGFGEGLCM